MEKVFDSILSWEGGSGTNKYLVSPRTVFDFFTQGIQLLRIPDYQRPYSWSKKNINDLLDDIYKLSLRQTKSSWFLGPLFTVKKSTEEKFSDLLDGQQRITTIQIILREASLIKYEEEGIDLSANNDLNKKIDKAINACNRCLVRLEGFTEVPIFQTEESLKEVFDSYILGFNEIENYSDLKSKRKTFKDKALKARVEGSITAGTILESINTVQEFFKDKFIKNKKSTTENMESFFSFVDALINKCWLIEIPLQNHNDSIQIFESLNNRGKKLTLVDKLRYKSIVKCSNENIEEVRLKWKKVYSGLNFLIDEKFVKNEDDFYKVFFNSIKGDDITKEDDFIEIFIETYLDSDKNILLFLNETISVVKFYKILSTSLDQKNTFITDNFNSNQQGKVKALLQLFKKALKISDNSRFLLFHLIRRYNDFNLEAFIIIQSIWNITRYVLFEEVYKNKKSNVIRTEYLDRVKKYNDNIVSISDGSEIKTFKFNYTFNYLLRTLNNNEAKFVIYFYTYLSDFNALISHNPIQYSYSQLDHLFPRAYKSNWSDKTYKKEEVLTYLNELYDITPEVFKHVNFNRFYLEIESSENFELLGYSTSPQFQEESIIEFIGNKWVLNARTNNKTSNNDFNFKKTEYLEDKWIKVPANSDEIGINNFDDFNYKTIINRSLTIANLISSKYYSTWDEL